MASASPRDAAQGTGLTRAKLGDTVGGISYRMIVQYERTDAQQPGPILPDRARGVTSDTLFGLGS